MHAVPRTHLRNPRPRLSCLSNSQQRAALAQSARIVPLWPAEERLSLSALSFSALVVTCAAPVLEIQLRNCVNQAWSDACVVHYTRHSFMACTEVHCVFTSYRRLHISSLPYGRACCDLRCMCYAGVASRNPAATPGARRPKVALSTLACLHFAISRWMGAPDERDGVRS